MSKTWRVFVSFLFVSVRDIESAWLSSSLWSTVSEKTPHSHLFVLFLASVYSICWNLARPAGDLPGSCACQIWETPGYLFSISLLIICIAVCLHMLSLKCPYTQMQLNDANKLWFWLVSLGADELFFVVCCFIQHRNANCLTNLLLPPYFSIWYLPTNQIHHTVCAQEYLLQIKLPILHSWMRRLDFPFMPIHKPIEYGPVCSTCKQAPEI